MKPSALGIEERAEIVYDYFSGQGCRSLATKHGLDAVGVFRLVKRETQLVEQFLDNSLHHGRMLGTTYKFTFGKTWQADGKVVRVTDTYASRNDVYSTRLFPTKGEEPAVYYDIYVEDVVETLNHVALCSKCLPVNRSNYVTTVLKKAEDIAGLPETIMVDTIGYRKAVWDAFWGKVILVVLNKEGKAGKLKIIEGYHLVMDRKLGTSIHGASPWELDGIRIHYNFVERKKRLGGLTPMEHAGLPRLSNTNTWLPLMMMARQFALKRAEAPSASTQRQERLERWLKPASLDFWPAN